MAKKKYLLKNKETGKYHRWSLQTILQEINRDRSDEWKAYNQKDWREGLATFTEYELIADIMKTKQISLDKHEARSAYEYIKELEDYVVNCEGEQDRIKMFKSYNAGGKLRRAISKLSCNG